MRQPKLEAALETAACLWEAVLSLRDYPGRQPRAIARAAAIRQSFEAIGTASVRLAAIGWTQAVETAWAAVADDYDMSFDWDFVPDWIIDHIDWSDPGRPCIQSRPQSSGGEVGGDGCGGDAAFNPEPLMTLPTTIHTAVGDTIIGKVTRLFNGSASDVLTELLQNARRAGATAIAIERLTEADRQIIVVRDDGKGIDDPAKLLCLGDSGWNDAIARREDPAGMGMFSLAGREVTVRSYSGAAGRGWQVTIAPDAWETRAPLAVEPCLIEGGTEIRIVMPDEWVKSFDNAVNAAALYYPLPVRFAGETVKRQDFLFGAERIEEWNGCRIAIVPGRMYDGANKPRINFHGLTVACDLPMVAEVGAAEAWRVLVDIVDAPALQLVLPARKEMVQNAALKSLREACEAAIYRTIARKGHHRLSYKDWCRARALGVDLPQAEPWLPDWFARDADTHGYYSDGRVAGEPCLLLPIKSAPIEQCISRVLDKGKLLGALPARQIDEFRGYDWYDAIPRVVGINIRIACEDGTYDFGDGTERPNWLESGKADSIEIEFAVQPTPDATQEYDIHALPVDVVIIPDDDYGGLDQTVVLLAPDAALSPSDLADLIEKSCFDPSEDSDADSWETQHREFQRGARYIATDLLLGEDEAVAERIRDAIREHICWLLPKGRPVEIRANGFDFDLAFDADDEAAAVLARA